MNHGAFLQPIVANIIMDIEANKMREGISVTLNKLVEVLLILNETDPLPDQTRMIQCKNCLKNLCSGQLSCIL